MARPTSAVAASGKLYTYRGNGDGTFGTGVTSDIGKNGAFLSAGDLNGDGKADLVSGGRFDNGGTPTAQTFIGLMNNDGTTRSSQLEADGQYSGGKLSASHDLHRHIALQEGLQTQATQHGERT